MENLKPTDHLKNLQAQAKGLTETALALDALFAAERAHLRRENAALILRAASGAIVEQMERMKESEASARYAYSQASCISFLGGLAWTALRSKSKGTSTITDYLIKNSSSREPSFGLVMVSIGPKGLPDDAGVVSISQLARESNREESEVMGELRGRGYLLYSEEAFSLLIDRLIDDVRGGRLRLPVSREKLSEMRHKTSIRLIPEP